MQGGAGSLQPQFYTVSQRITPPCTWAQGKLLNGPAGLAANPSSLASCLFWIAKTTCLQYFWLGFGCRHLTSTIRSRQAGRPVWDLRTALSGCQLISLAAGKDRNTTSGESVFSVLNPNPLSKEPACPHLRQQPCSKAVCILQHRNLSLIPGYLPVCTEFIKQMEIFTHISTMHSPIKTERLERYQWRDNRTHKEAHHFLIKN